MKMSTLFPLGVRGKSSGKHGACGGVRSFGVLFPGHPAESKLHEDNCDSLAGEGKHSVHA